jgi:hypothetical protein
MIDSTSEHDEMLFVVTRLAKIDIWRILKFKQGHLLQDETVASYTQHDEVVFALRIPPYLPIPTRLNPL